MRSLASQVSVGAVPSRNHSRRDSPQNPAASLPVAISMRWLMMPAGGAHAISCSGLCHPSRIKRAHTGAARRPPVASPPRGAGSSRPNQTLATSDGVNPTNHTSVPSLVVPVLPATGPRIPALRTLRPVPSSTTLRSNDVTRNASRASITCGDAEGGRDQMMRPNTSSTCSTA